MDTQLDTEVRQALVRLKGQWPEIARECGVSHSWISQFVRDKIPNPGFATLKRLRTHLAASEGAPSEPATATGA